MPEREQREANERLLLQVAVVAAVALGVVIRAVYVLSEDFPLNDGGLFYAMVRDLQAARYQLPAFTSYNEAGIPFAYPPLGFYAAGLLADLTGLSLVTVFHLLPLVATSLTVVAFFFLARAMLSSRIAVVVAVCAFALIPRSFIWLLMGGGVTRSFGLLFAILALHQVYLLYTRPDWRTQLRATLFAALTVLSHLETGAFLAFSIAVFFLACGRHRRGVISSVLLAAGTVLLTAPWWATVVLRHGIEPFVAAGATGGSVFTGGYIRWFLLITVARFGLGFTGEPLFPVIGVLAVLGGLTSLVRGQWLLPAWWAAIILLDERAFPTYTTLPIALLVGIGVADLLLPALRRLGAQTPPAPHVPHWAPQWVPALVLVLLLCYATVAALTRDRRLGSETWYMVSLSKDERAAMRLVADAPPHSSRFLVITGAAWPTDKTSEWFPALTRQMSVVTAQGYEWLPGGVFEQRADAYAEAQACAQQDVSCLERWAAKTGTAFTYIYVPQPGPGQCCTTLPLLTSLRTEPRYLVVYDAAGATIATRR
ncbi:MAG: hypothetical protein M3442_12660 [Chloroflexota bacterium]|nr:hypothetical protein [Chloroflexota bacterium]